jgi:hypothetical protein
MTIPISVRAIVILLTSILLASAQQPLPSTPPLRGPGSPIGTKVKQEPCWQEAGVSKATMEERRSIEQGVRSQISAVCADPSLTTQQRNEKIREIHQQAHQQVEALITPQQQEAMKACQQSRAHASGGGGGGRVHIGHAGGGGGPCGEMPEPKPAPTPPSQPQP